MRGGSKELVRKGLSEDLTFILRLEVGGVNFGKIRTLSILEEQASVKLSEAAKCWSNRR